MGGDAVAQVRAGSARAGLTGTRRGHVKGFVIDRYKPSDGGRLAEVPDPVQRQVAVRLSAVTADRISALGLP